MWKYFKSITCDEICDCLNGLEINYSKINSDNKAVINVANEEKSF